MRLNLRYIIQRILIGAGIILLVGSVKSCDVHALEYYTSAYYDELSYNYQYYGGSGMNAFTRAGFWKGTSSVNFDLYYGGILPSSTLSSGNYYIGWTLNQQLRKGSLYSLTFDMCGTGTFTYDPLKLYLNVTSSPVSETNVYSGGAFQQNTYGGMLWHYNFNGNIGTSSTCQRYYFVFDPPSNNGGITVYFPNFKVSSNINFVIAGYQLTYIGAINNLSSSDVQSVVDNAINKSTNSINSNIDQMEEALKSEMKSMQDKQDETNNKLDEMNDTLTNSSTDDPSSSFNEYNDKLAKNGVITNLLTLPIRLFTNILNSINGTCTTFSLGNLMGTDLTLPCINVSSYLGTELWNIIDILFSGLFVLVIAKKMIKVFENFSSMREGDVIGD